MRAVPLREETKSLMKIMRKHNVPETFIKNKNALAFYRSASTPTLNSFDIHRKKLDTDHSEEEQDIAWPTPLQVVGCKRVSFYTVS